MGWVEKRGRIFEARVVGEGLPARIAFQLFFPRLEIAMFFEPRLDAPECVGEVRAIGLVLGQNLLHPVEPLARRLSARLQVRQGLLRAFPLFGIAGLQDCAMPRLFHCLLQARHQQCGLASGVDLEPFAQAE